MKILDAYDLTRSLRDAAELAGCSPNTVKRYVDQRAAGGVVEDAAVRPQLIDEFLPKVEELVERSHGKVRADVAHDKLVAMGYTGSERTTRRAVAQVRAAYRDGRVRVHRPWVPEPGMWLQYDYGQGPLVAGAATVLFCAWLAWSRFRVVLALRDKTLPSVFAALDQTFRLLGGVPTYVLTDNEKTVTSEHIAGIAVRNPQLVAWAGHYAVTVHTCLPADPASKGGSEASVRVSKADLVPTDANLLAEYQTFADLQKARGAVQGEVNTRPHRLTRRPPVQMSAEERARLHPVAAIPYTVAFGTTRTVPPNTPMITFEGGQYSVPHRLPGPDGEAFGGISMLGKTVWVRGYGVGGIGEQVVITYLDPARGPVEIARRGAGASPPATTAPPRAARGSTTRTSRPHQLARWTGCRRPRMLRRQRSWSSATGRCCGCGKQQLPERARCGSRWPRRSTCRGCSIPATWTGHLGMPPCMAGSPRLIWPPSSTTTPATPGPGSPRQLVMPARRTHWPKARPAGHDSANPPSPSRAAPSRAAGRSAGDHRAECVGPEVRGADPAAAAGRSRAAVAADEAAPQPPGRA